MQAVAIGGKTTRGIETLFTACDEIEDAGGNGGADDLRDPIGEKIARRETLPGHETKGYGRVEVSARDMADGIGHSQHGKAKGKGDAYEADAKRREGGCQYGAAAAAQDEP